MAMENFHPLFQCEGLTNLIPPSGSLQRATHIAGAIVMSDIYSTAMHRLFTSNIKKDGVKRYINKMINEAKTFKLKRIREVSGHDAYALVDRERHPDSIYLSTLMLCEMHDVEDEEIAMLPEVHPQGSFKRARTEGGFVNFALCAKRHAIFLAIKLVHEISRLINCAVNTLFTIDSVLSSPTKAIDNNVFDDIGAMIEYSLFGGLVEHYPSISQNAFAISDILKYKSKGTNDAYIVCVDTNDAFFQISHPKDCIKSTLNLNVENQPIKYKSTGNRGKLNNFTQFGKEADGDSTESSEAEESKFQALDSYRFRA